MYSRKSVDETDSILIKDLRIRNIIIELANSITFRLKTEIQSAGIL